MINQTHEKYELINIISLPTLVIISLLIIWQILTIILDIPKWLLPSPITILMEIYNNFSLLIGHSLVTIQEIFFGFIFALILGIALAISIDKSRVVEKSIYPFVIASQTIPIIAITPLLLVWIGYGIFTKIIIVALISFFPIVVNMVDGLRSTDISIEKMAITLGANKFQLLTLIRIPSSLPYLFSGMKIGISISVIGAVIGEWVGASSGLGYLMLQSAPRFQTALVFASIFFLSIIGISLFTFIQVLEYKLVRWNRFSNY